MKKVLFAAIVGMTAFACGPSNDTTTDTPVNISSSPTGDTAITDDGTGAKEAEAPDTTTNRTDTSSTNMPDTTYHP